MPRLARWTFNAFWAAAQLQLTIADCVHFLMPGSPYHAPLLQCLPEQLRAEWAELIAARGAEVGRILESTRNRLKPYFESDILRRMFGSTESRLDVLRFLREGRIVLLNLAPQNRLSAQLADAIGALVLNEVLATARSLPMGVRYPTYVLLDEFQNFVGPDIESALPEVRQLGIRLILSHQSFSQLRRGEYDLTAMIFQAQSRMVFGIQGEDADLLAQEFASLTYDPKRIKDEQYVAPAAHQGATDHFAFHLVAVRGRRTETWNTTVGRNWSTHQNVSHGLLRDTVTDGSSEARSENKGEGGSRGRTHTSGGGEHVVPVYEDYDELASRVFYTFDEQKNLWASQVRRLKTGACLLRLVDDPALYDVDVKRDAPGHLAWDAETLLRHYPRAIEERDRLVEQNYRSDLFVPPEIIEAQTQERIVAVLQAALPAPRPAGQPPVATTDQTPVPFVDPFA